LFFDAVDCMQVIRCGRENDEGVGWGRQGLDIYLLTWDTTMVGGTEAGEMDHDAYDQVAFITRGDLTTMQLLEL